MQMLVLFSLSVYLLYFINLRFEAGKVRKILKLLSKMQDYLSSLRNMVAVALSTKDSSRVIIR